MLIVGVNAYHGDASAAAVVDGRLVAAAEEERFCRIKHAAGFPAEALRYVVKAAGASPRDIDMLAVARDPWARIVRKAWHAIKMPLVARDRLSAQAHFASIGEEAARALGADARSIPVARIEHHRAHLASSFLVSPFDEAALFSIDGLGDFASAMWGVGRGGSISPLGVVTFPHSLGMFYTALTQYLGFPKYGDEYKVMGLASYGEPEMVEEFRRIVIAPNGGRMDFMLAPEYFTYQKSGAEMTWSAGEPTIGRLYSNFLVERLGAVRDAAEPVDKRHIAIAASMQRRLEEVIIDRLRSLQRATGLKRLCLAGGVAYNCVVNGKILEQTGFEDIYIQSAAGDAGLAIGAAFDQWHSSAPRERGFVMEHANWGPEFRADEIAALLSSRESEIASQGCAISKIENEDELCRATAATIAGLTARTVTASTARSGFRPSAIAPSRQELGTEMSASQISAIMIGVIITVRITTATSRPAPVSSTVFCTDTFSELVIRSLPTNGTSTRIPIRP